MSEARAEKREELKPCPCGSRPELYASWKPSGLSELEMVRRYDEFRQWNYQCKCGRCGGFASNPIDAIAAWNRRTA